MEITAPLGTPLAGYGARGPGNASRGVLEPVSARALVLEQDGGPRVALVVLDALIVTRDLRDALASAARAHDIDTLVVAATHTHSGPGGYLDKGVAELAILGWYREESRAALLRAASAALATATRSLAPATLAVAQADGDALARNRRRAEGPRDPLVPVLGVDRSDGTPIATLFSLAAHPTVFSPANLRLSPDYPGAARRRVETLRGGLAIFLAGPLGDQKPHFADEPEWPEDLDRQARTATLIGEALGEAVASALEGAPRAADAPVHAVTREWSLPPVDVRASCAYWIGAPVLHWIARDFLPEVTPLVALRLGGLRLFASPLELGVEVADALRRRARGDGTLLIAAHANDWLGYLLMPEDWDRGGYEPCLAYHGRELAPRFVEEAGDVLDALP